MAKQKIKSNNQSLTLLSKKEPPKVLGVDEALKIIEEVTPHLSKGEERLVQLMMRVTAAATDVEYTLDEELVRELRELEETIHVAEGQRESAIQQAAFESGEIERKTSLIVDWFQRWVDRINRYLRTRNINKLSRVCDKLETAKAEATVTIQNAKHRRSDVDKVANFFTAPTKKE